MDKTMNRVMEDVLDLLRLAPIPPEDVLPQGATVDAIVAFEGRTGLHVPEQLRSWLLSSNGPCVGPGGLLGINPARSSLDIEFVIGLHPDWGKRGWVPVAGDGFGNFYLVVTGGEFGPGEPVVFVESIEGDEIPAFIAASSIWHFLRFLLKKELGRSRWPFNQEEVQSEDPDIRRFVGLPVPWDT